MVKKIDDYIDSVCIQEYTTVFISLQVPNSDLKYVYKMEIKKFT